MQNLCFHANQLSKVLKCLQAKRKHAELITFVSLNFHDLVTLFISSSSIYIYIYIPLYIDIDIFTHHFSFRLCFLSYSISNCYYTFYITTKELVQHSNRT